jgi:hypothetical protein
MLSQHAFRSLSHRRRHEKCAFEKIPLNALKTRYGVSLAIILPFDTLYAMQLTKRHLIKKEDLSSAFNAHYCN